MLEARAEGRSTPLVSANTFLVSSSIPRAPTSRPRPSSTQRNDSPKSPTRVQRGSSIGPVHPSSSSLSFSSSGRVGSPSTRPPPLMEEVVLPRRETAVTSSPPRRLDNHQEVVYAEEPVVPVGRRVMVSPPRLGATIPPTSPPRRIDRIEEFVVSSPPPQEPQQLVVSPIRIPTPHDVHLAATAVGSVIEENPHNPGPETLTVHNSSSKQISQQEMNSTSAESAVVLVGWSEADASAMIDDVNNSIRVDGDDTGFVVPPQQRQQPQQDPHMPQREEPSRQDQQHHPQHRRASTSPHPVFVVPSRDSSVDSRRSASALRNTQHLMDVDASQQQLRWEEIRLPEGRNPHRASSPMFVPPAAGALYQQQIPPLLVSQYDDVMPPMNTHYVIPFASSAATLGDFSNSQIPNYHTATPQVVPSSSCAIDALAVGGHGAAIHKMSPALASYATTASTSPHQNHQHYNAWDVRGPSVVTDYSANIQKYTTQDLFPTKIRASLARSQSPPESSPSLPTVTARQQASLQLRSALGQQHLHRHPALIRPTIESGAVWGDAHSTTAPTFTPRDSLNSSAAFVASLDRLRRSESLIDESQDSMRTRRTTGSTKAAATAMDEGASAYGGGGSSHVSFCDEAVGAQQILGKDRAAGGAAESSGNRSTTHGRPPIAQPPSTTVASREHNVMPPPMCDTSVAFDVEIEDDAVAKSEQPAAPRRSQKELPDDEEDVFLDVRCEEDNHERRRATTSSSQQRDASPAFSTNSFLTVLSGRAASARGISSELFDKATSPTRPTSTSSVVDDSRLRRPVDTNAFVSNWNHERSHPTTTTTSPPHTTTTVADSEQRLRTLSVAMEAVVPSVPPQNASGTRPAAAAPFALSVPRERSPAFHEFIQMFGRNSEERDLMLLEVQRQRVAAEAAVIELQIKSMERDLKEASPLSSVSRHVSSRTTLPPPLTHHEQHQRPQKSVAVDLTSAYPSQQSPPPPSSTLASPWRPQHQVPEATLQGNHTIHSPLPVAPSTAAATGFKPAPTRSQPKATTLQELFALAATTSSAARQTSTTRASSSSNAQQQRAISALLPRDDMRPTRLEELAASASPLPAATGAAGAASLGPSIPAAVSQKLLTIDRQGHLSSATSSAGHTGEGRSSSSSSQRNWSVSSPSAVGTPTTRGVATVLPLTLPFSPSDQKFAPIVYRNCSALRPLTRSLLSTLIRLDSGSNGSVTLTDCVTAVQSVLEKANVGPVDIANTSSFLAEIMPRVQHAHHGGGGGGSGATTAAAASTHSIPYAALVSTIVEIATEDPSRAHTPFAASLTSPQMNTNTRAQQQTSSYRHFDFGSPTFPQFA